MNRITRLALLLSASFILMATWAVAQNGQPTRDQRWHAVSDGAYAYNLYCASCHGASGKGDGPQAAQLRTKVPDLRTIASRNGGYDRTFVLEHIYASNRWQREPMPAWGAALRTGLERSDALALLAAHNLARHVESLQEVQARR